MQPNRRHFRVFHKNPVPYLLSTLLFFIFTMGTVAMTFAENNLLDQLPETVDGWQASQDTVYTPDNLYDYINGGAELYLSYGFKDVLSRTYVRPEQPDILVDIFDMGRAANSFGVFAHTREVVDTTFGQGSQYTSGSLVFWKGRYFVSIFTFPETKASKAALMTLGNQIEQAIAEKGELPAILNLLPPSNRVEASVRYFRHHIWLNARYFIAHDNVLHITDKTEAVLARYDFETQSPILLIVDYADPKTADDALTDFRESYLDGLDDAETVQLEDETWVGLRQIDSYGMVVFNAANAAQVQQLIEATTHNIEERSSP